MNEKLDFQNSDISKKRKFVYKTAIGVLIAIFFSGIAALSVLSENRKSGWIFEENISPESNNYSNSPTDILSNESSKETVAPELFPVYIVGEIKSPGIYYVENFIYLFELVDLAGGFTDMAACEQINLVFSVNESMTIRIPSVSEMSENSKMDYMQGILIGDNNYEGQKNSAPEKVNINTAAKASLETLPGVGPSTAEAIITHRNKFGYFKSIEDIMNVSGIKENKFNMIKDKITVSD